MVRSRSTDALFERYYFGRRGFRDGTAEFHDLCRASIPQGSHILEVGAGPSNATTRALAAIGPVLGADVSGELATNADLSWAVVYDGTRLPLRDTSVDACVSNFVLEHVADPAEHFREVARVLRPGGVYVTRTPNQWHYVTIASRLLPHRAHVSIAKWSRGQTDEDHDPWRTFYRTNTRRVIERLSGAAGLQIRELRTVEKEPSYGRALALLFYPMMAYERLVNWSESLAFARSAIFAVLQRPDNGAQ